MGLDPINNLAKIDLLKFAVLYEVALNAPETPEGKLGPLILKPIMISGDVSTHQGIHDMIAKGLIVGGQLNDTKNDSPLIHLQKSLFSESPSLGMRKIHILSDDDSESPMELESENVTFIEDFVDFLTGSTKAANTNIEVLLETAKSTEEAENSKNQQNDSQRPLDTFTGSAKIEGPFVRNVSTKIKSVVTEAFAAQMKKTFEKKLEEQQKEIHETYRQVDIQLTDKAENQEAIAQQEAYEIALAHALKNGLTPPAPPSGAQKA